MKKTDKNCRSASNKRKVDIGLNRYHQNYIGYLTWIQKRKKFKHGWIAQRFKEKFNFYPPWGYIYAPLKPTEKILKELTTPQLSKKDTLASAIKETESFSALNHIPDGTYNLPPPTKPERKQRVLHNPSFLIDKK